MTEPVDFTVLLESVQCTAAGAGLKAYVKRHLVYLLMRQFKLLLQDFSVSVELDQAVDLDLGGSRNAMQLQRQQSLPAFHAVLCPSRHL